MKKKMTFDEMMEQLKYDRAMANFNPTTGEEKPMNEDCRKTVEALTMAIELLEKVRPKNKLMNYIPKEFKDLVVKIYEGEKEFDEEKRRWDTPLIVEWKNGEKSIFQNKTFARFVLKECHNREEYE